MEAFFRKDQEIQELVDVFIEKLFTVNILSGSDADSEFYRGRQAVEKIASFFQEMAELPEEALMDGIRQLVEQRLPDSRVIENFPNFYDLMNEMILAALPRTAAVPYMISIPQPDTPQIPINLSPLGRTTPSPSSKIVLNGGRAPISYTQDPVTPFSLRQHLYPQSPDSLKSNPELFLELDSSLNITDESQLDSTPNISNEYDISGNSANTTVSDVIPDLLETKEPVILKATDTSTVNVIVNKQDPEILDATDIAAYTDSVSASQAFNTINTIEASPQKPSEASHPTPLIANSQLNQYKSPFKLGSIIKAALNSASITIEPAGVMESENPSAEPSENKLPIENISTPDKAELETPTEPVMAKANLISEMPKKAGDNISNPPPRRDPFRFNPKKSKLESLTQIATPIPPQTKPVMNPIVSESSLTPSVLSKNSEKILTTKSRVVRTNQMPEDGERLAMVLRQIFPGFSIRWNVVIGKNTFYAQIDKVLVCVLEPASESDIKHIEHIKSSLKKEGWSVYICRKEDLAYPRRLERGIRLIIR